LRDGSKNIYRSQNNYIFCLNVTNSDRHFRPDFADKYVWSYAYARLMDRPKTHIPLRRDTTCHVASCRVMSCRAEWHLGL